MPLSEKGMSSWLRIRPNTLLAVSGLNCPRPRAAYLPQQNFDQKSVVLVVSYEHFVLSSAHYPCKS